MNDVRMTNSLYMKTFLKADTFNVLSIGITFSILCFGYLLHLASREYPINCASSNGAFGSLFNCIWLIIITITTVGYGSISANKWLGRAVSLIAAGSGIFLTAILIDVMQNQIHLTKEEEAYF